MYAGTMEGVSEDLEPGLHLLPTSLGLVLNCQLSAPWCLTSPSLPFPASPKPAAALHWG